MEKSPTLCRTIINRVQHFRRRWLNLSTNIFSDFTWCWKEWWMSRYVFQMGSSTDGQFFVRLLIYSNRISLSISTLWHVLRLNLHLLFMIAEIIAIKMRTRKKNRFNFSSFLHEVCLSILQKKKTSEFADVLADFNSAFCWFLSLLVISKRIQWINLKFYGFSRQYALKKQ